MEYERFQRERLPVCSEFHHELIETSCTIMDLKNVGVSQFWKVSSYVQQASRIGQYYYPETMGTFDAANAGRFFIINAPYIFTTVWSVIKGWLDPVTTEKIQILGSNPVNDLSKQIPLENLPAILGGKCECPGGCALSDAGPWKTPEGEEIIKKVNEAKQKAKDEYEHRNDPSHKAQSTTDGSGAGTSSGQDAIGGTAAAGAASSSTAATGATPSSTAPDAAPGSQVTRVDSDATEYTSAKTTPTVQPQDETVIPTSSSQVPPVSSESLAPPLTHTSELSSPVTQGDEIQLSNSKNGELAPAITHT